MTKFAMGCATVLLLAFLVAFTFLTYGNHDSTALMTLFNTLLNFVGVTAAGGAWLYAGKAAKQTNGALDGRIRDAVTHVLDNRTDVPGEVNKDG